MKDALAIALLGFFAVVIFIVMKSRSPVVQVSDVKPAYSLPDGLPVGDNAPAAADNAPAADANTLGDTTYKDQIVASLGPYWGYRWGLTQEP